MHISFRASKIWLFMEAVDFRKSINGLCAIVVEELKDNPGDGLYIFYNNAKNRLKLLGWHGNGFILLYKRLGKGKFSIEEMEERYAINNRELRWLLAGLDWKMLSNWDKPEVKEYF